MFINLNASKPNGDFMITSTDVLQEKHPTATPAELAQMLFVIGNEYEVQGYQLKYTFE